ncbi:hypothetical protein ZIOFF_074506 (mitochondrion) [Zingiber officinale]|uniref:Uncharacterized protein n=1 Tax=Zingiber officinale TaxID=94328 RepID=A0A8J5ET47_ZINOF|nr:hypothetical protein ZIOFF_074506 [Zingiber officinale]
MEFGKRAIFEEATARPNPSASGAIAGGTGDSPRGSAGTATSRYTPIRPRSSFGCRPKDTRDSLLNLGGNDDLGRMVSIIDNQVVVERDVEAALVEEGFRRESILASYTEIRGILHSPQGELLSNRTYQFYVSQIRERGTRQSVPYRRIVRAIQNFDLFFFFFRKRIRGLFIDWCSPPYKRSTKEWDEAPGGKEEWNLAAVPSTTNKANRSVGVVVLPTERDYWNSYIGLLEWNPPMCRLSSLSSISELVGGTLTPGQDLPSRADPRHRPCPSFLVRERLVEPVNYARLPLLLFASSSEIACPPFPGLAPSELFHSLRTSSLCTA